MAKSKNTFILVGVLAVLGLIYMVVQFTGGKTRSKSFRSSLVEINQDQVTRIEIDAREEKTVLFGGPDDWKVEVANGVEKPAKKSAVIGFLSSLETIEPSRIAARSKDKWMDFQVDSAGTRVKVFEGSKKALDIVLGRFGVEGQRSFYTYVRLAEDDDTYVANNFMSMSLGSSPDGFRFNDVFRLAKDSLTSINFNYPDSGFVLSKSGTQWVIDGQQTDSAAVAKYLSGITNVSSRNFDESDFGPEGYQVTYQLTNREDITVKVDTDGTLQSSENGSELFRDEALVEKIFKGKGYFLGQ